MRTALLCAALLMLIAPASAGPIGELCYDDPCVDADAHADGDGAEASLIVRVGNGAGVFTDAGTHGANVGWGVGITRCNVGTDGVGCVY